MRKWYRTGTSFLTAKTYRYWSIHKEIILNNTIQEPGDGNRKKNTLLFIVKKKHTRLNNHIHLRQVETVVTYVDKGLSRRYLVSRHLNHI